MQTSEAGLLASLVCIFLVATSDHEKPAKIAEAAVKRALEGQVHLHLDDAGATFGIFHYAEFVTSGSRH